MRQLLQSVRRWLPWALAAALLAWPAASSQAIGVQVPLKGAVAGAVKAAPAAVSHAVSAVPKSVPAAVKSVVEVSKLPGELPQVSVPVKVPAPPVKPPVIPVKVPAVPVQVPTVPVKLPTVPVKAPVSPPKGGTPQVPSVKVPVKTPAVPKTPALARTSPVATPAVPAATGVSAAPAGAVGRTVASITHAHSRATSSAVAGAAHATLADVRSAAAAAAAQSPGSAGAAGADSLAGEALRSPAESAETEGAGLLALLKSGPALRAGERAVRKLVLSFSGCLAVLPRRLRLVLELRTGVDVARALPPRAVAAYLHLPSSQVPRLEIKAVRRLHALADRGQCPGSSEAQAQPTLALASYVTLSPSGLATASGAVDAYRYAQRPTDPNLHSRSGRAPGGVVLARARDSLAWIVAVFLGMLLVAFLFADELGKGPRQRRLRRRRMPPRDGGGGA